MENSGESRVGKEKRGKYLYILNTSVDAGKPMKTGVLLE